MAQEQGVSSTQESELEVVSETDFSQDGDEVFETEMESMYVDSDPGQLEFEAQDDGTNETDEDEEDELYDLVCSLGP